LILSTLLLLHFAFGNMEELFLPSPLMVQSFADIFHNSSLHSTTLWGKLM
jgi:hypothetical protein